MEAPETLGGGGWNLDGLPSSCIEGSHRRLGLLTAAGEGVTSGELGREMAGDVEGVGLCNLLLLAFTSTAPGTAPGTDAVSGFHLCAPM